MHFNWRYMFLVSYRKCGGRKAQIAALEPNGTAKLGKIDASECHKQKLLDLICCLAH